MFIHSKNVPPLLWRMQLLRVFIEWNDAENIGQTVQDFIGSGADVTTETFPKLEDELEPQTSKNIAIGPQHFEMLCLLGSGATAKVILVRCLLNQRVYAMKVLDKSTFQSESQIATALHERRVLARVTRNSLLLRIVETPLLAQSVLRIPDGY